MTANFTFNAPVSDGDRHVAAVCLASGNTVTVAGSRLQLDAHLDLVWGTDAYGVDYVAGNGRDAPACLQAIDKAIVRAFDDGRHPAEYSW